MAVGKQKESVWDYPRPPRVESVVDRVRVQFAGEWIADSLQALRVLETSHPPTYYLPPTDIQMEYLQQVQGYRTFCEWKGQASYYDLALGERRSTRAAWFYANPSHGYQALKDHVAFYPNRVDACFVGDEQVQAQEGSFYGGWITSNIEGPFKGGAGTTGW